MKNYDLVVIGGGPGGYVASIRAAQLGLKVALIEKEHLGGVCLNWGCIPTKALLRSAEIVRYIKHAKNYGIEVPICNVDISQMVSRSRQIAEQLANGVKGLMAKNKVDVYNGHAKILSQGKVELDDNQLLTTKDIIIATGARAKIYENFIPDGEHIISIRDAMTPATLPKSIIIVGGGAIGVEFASFYNALGVKVTLLEAQDRILPVEDHEIADFARKSFEQQGIKIVTNVKLLNHTKTDQNINLTVEIAEQVVNFEANKLLLAVGVCGNIENIGLENTTITTKNSYILVDDHMQTTEENIYAIGDVAGPPCLAHKASHQAVLAVEKIANLAPHKIETNNIPACTYSFPQIASLGLTESKARELNYPLKIGKFPFYANGKALALGETEGMVKTIFDASTGELLGVHMIGTEVTEMISSYLVAKNLEATELELINSIFPHPTLSEILHESVLNALERAIHI